MLYPDARLRSRSVGTRGWLFGKRLVSAVIKAYLLFSGFRRVVINVPWYLSV